MDLRVQVQPLLFSNAGNVAQCTQIRSSQNPETTVTGSNWRAGSGRTARWRRESVGAEESKSGLGGAATVPIRVDRVTGETACYKGALRYSHIRGRHFPRLLLNASCRARRV